VCRVIEAQVSRREHGAGDVRRAAAAFACFVAKGAGRRRSHARRHLLEAIVVRAVTSVAARRRREQPVAAHATLRGLLVAIDAPRTELRVPSVIELESDALRRIHHRAGTVGRRLRGGCSVSVRRRFCACSLGSERDAEEGGREARKGEEHGL
jgi:hypothetical protein